MKAVHLKKGIVSICSRPDPVLRTPHDCIIKTAYASICGCDMMTFRGEADEPNDGFIGHEASGILVQKGEAVSSEFEIGDRVVLEPFLRCMRCNECRSGRVEYCENKTVTTTMMAEYIVVDERQVYKLPENISLKAGCLTEPVIMGLQAVSNANIDKGKNVIILGGGAMGQIILRLAHLYPVSSVIVVEINERKRKMAKEAGATAVINPEKENVVAAVMDLTNSRGGDCVIEASGSRRSAELAIHLTARGGSLVYFSLYGADFQMTINPFSLFWKDITLRGCFVPAFTMQKALEIMPRVNMEEVITAVYPFEQAPEAFDAKYKGDHAKVALQFSWAKNIF